MLIIAAAGVGCGQDAVSPVASDADVVDRLDEGPDSHNDEADGFDDSQVDSSVDSSVGDETATDHPP